MKNSDISFKAKMLSSFLRNFSLKINLVPLKKFIDLGFVIVEKFVLKLNRFIPLYVKYYEDIIDAEINLAHISKNDYVLHIGCGSVPSTSILISQKTKSPVTAIDNNNRSVQEAKSCIVSLHMDKKIQVVYADALDFSIENFDVIIVSHGVRPQDKVLKHLSNFVKSDSRVIFRTTSSKNGGLTGYDVSLLKDFKIVKTVSHSQHGLLVSILLSKK